MTRLRAATEADRETVAALEQEIFGPDAWSPALLPLEATWLGEQEGQLRGYAVATIAGDVADLQRIAVVPDARRSGVGSRLLDAVSRRCRDLGAHRMLLEVRADNSVARAFYAGRGFVQIDQRRRYYLDGTDALVLCRPLTRGCGGSA